MSRQESKEKALRHPAGPSDGNWAQKQMGLLSRSSKMWVGDQKKLSLQLPLTAWEKEHCWVSGHCGCLLSLLGSPARQPGPAESLGPLWGFAPLRTKQTALHLKN